MTSYSDPSTLWDLSQAQSFSQLPDDDFLALLQKQFPSTIVPPGLPINPNSQQQPQGVNPQSLDDSLNPHKRKAFDDDDDDDESPSAKNTKKNSPITNSKRKSFGSPHADDTRLLKRKEQNRAAQRAFRERKEKHVKELQDKVDALEARNDETVNENQNLRDLLSRLQNENMMLKQQQFTFQMSKNAASSSTSPPMQSEPSSSSSSSAVSSAPYSQHSPFSIHGASPFATPTPPFSVDSMDPLEYSSYSNLDPNAFNLFDDFSQSSKGPMDIDFSFGDRPNSDPNNNEFIMVASNPVFASMPAIFDVNPPQNISSSSTNPATTSAHNLDSNILPDFDINSLSAWPLPTSSQPGMSGTLDDLFGYPAGATPDFSAYSNPALQQGFSPVVHHMIPGSIQQIHSNASSPSSHGSDPSIFSAASNHESPCSDLSDTHNDPSNKKTMCPKTRSEYEQVVVRDGPSVFSPPGGMTAPQQQQLQLQVKHQQDALTTMRKLTNEGLGPMVVCQGTALPKTEKSEKNVEVLTAWRTIRNDPRYKDLDINHLCSEFSAKAKCDGTKVCPAGADGTIDIDQGYVSYLKKMAGMEGNGTHVGNGGKDLGTINGGLGPLPHRQAALPQQQYGGQRGMP